MKVLLRIIYFILGVFVSFNLAYIYRNSLESEKDSLLASMQYQYGCGFIAAKVSLKNNLNFDELQDICVKESHKIKNNYKDISVQMDEIIDKQ